VTWAWLRAVIPAGISVVGSHPGGDLAGREVGRQVRDHDEASRRQGAGQGGYDPGRVVRIGQEMSNASVF
jgi:hypothetical protein